MSKIKAYYSNFDVEDVDGNIDPYSVSTNKYPHRIKVKSLFKSLKKPLLFSWNNKKHVGSCTAGKVYHFHYEYRK